MTHSWRAELFGGPLDGQEVTINGEQATLLLPLPGPPSPADFDAPADLSGPAVATYELFERVYLDITAGEAFLRGLPPRPTVGGKYRWKP